MIIVRNTGAVVSPTVLAQELDLQNAIQQFPALFNLVTELVGQKTPLFLIGRELNLGAGPMDFLAVDVVGTLYIIETKLAKNPELRRTVIGQIIHYAQQLADTTYETLGKRCAPFLKHSTSLETAIHKFYKSELSKLGEDSKEVLSADQYRKQIMAQLQLGQFVALIVADHVNLETQRLFNYLDEVTSQHINFIVLEINSYAIDGQEVMHSAMLWAAKYIKAVSVKNTKQRDDFLAHRTPQVRQLIEVIDEHCRAENLVPTIYPNGLSWKNEAGGSIVVTTQELRTNWATLPSGSSKLDDECKRVMAEANAAGFTQVKGIHGGVKLKLTDSVKQETVERFLESVLKVLKVATSVAPN